uniref:PAZ domain-containing protein n=1 Tax=Panagrolaimus sp. JU765 TaxID=591449 RepID=A0AC34QU22_9BILA
MPPNYCRGGIRRGMRVGHIDFGPILDDSNRQVQVTFADREIIHPLPPVDQRRFRNELINLNDVVDDGKYFIKNFSTKSEKPKAENCRNVPIYQFQVIYTAETQLNELFNFDTEKFKFVDPKEMFEEILDHFLNRLALLTTPIVYDKDLNVFLNVDLRKYDLNQPFPTDYHEMDFLRQSFGFIQRIRYNVRFVKQFTIYSLERYGYHDFSPSLMKNLYRMSGRFLFNLFSDIGSTDRVNQKCPHIIDVFIVFYNRIHSRIEMCQKLNYLKFMYNKTRIDQLVPHIVSGCLFKLENWEQANDILRGIYVKSASKTVPPFPCRGLSELPASKLYMEFEGKKVSVKQYFKEKHGLETQCEDLPCVIRYCNYTIKYYPLDLVRLDNDLTKDHYLH